MTIEQPEGGWEWEAGESLKLVVTGLTRFSEAMRNLVVAQLAAVQAPMYQAQQRNEADRKTDVASFAHTVLAVLDEAEVGQAEQGRQAARLGILEIKQADLIALLKLARTIPELTERIATLENHGQSTENTNHLK